MKNNNNKDLEYSSEHKSERLTSLFKKVNISSFAKERSLARKTLYKMRDSGVMSRELLLDMCAEAEVNPALVEFSPSERVFFIGKLTSAVKESAVEDLYSKQIEQVSGQEKRDFLLSISLLHELYKSSEMTTEGYTSKIKEIFLNYSLQP